MDLQSLVLGVVVGLVLGYVLAARVRPPAVRLSGRASVRRRPTTSGTGPDLGLVTDGHHGRWTTTTTHLAVSIRLPGSTVHLDDGRARVEVDGTTYHQLADVPTEAKMRLVEELGRAIDSGTLPEPARAAIESFLAGQTPTAGV
jgi:hypothetical protein